MSIKKQFWRNILPSMAAFAFSGLYTIVDGFFVGQNIGNNGIASVNVAYPIAAFIQAAGTGIGMAGAIWIAISCGEHNEKKKNEYLGNTFLLLILFSIVLTILLSVLYRPLLIAFGARGTIFDYASDYLKIIVLGTAFQLCAVGLLPIIRNFGGAMVAMLAMILGFSSNVIGDWYFTSVLKWGTAGAAGATVLGQMISLIPCILFLIYKRELFRAAKLRFSGKCIKKICLTALAPFGSTISPMLVIIIMNKAALTFGGETEVACYAVISYVIAVAYLLLQGIGDGIQPLIGRYYGSNDFGSLNVLKRMAYAVSVGTTICCIFVFIASRSAVPYLFGASASVSVMYQEVLPYFIIGLLFVSIFKISSCYLYATSKIRLAYTLIYLEPLLVAILAGGVLPRLWQMNGVWMAIPAAQLSVALLSIIFLFKVKE